MPVQVFPSEHGANRIKDSFVEDALDVLMGAWPESRFHELLQSSFDGDDNLPANMITSSNGLIHSIIRAYGGHHHLRIRPEDIWFAVLTQLSLYVNKNAEQLRDKFVQHEGKKTLRIDYDVLNHHQIDYGAFSRDMGEMLQKHVVDPDLRGWMMPSFTTTTDQDSIVASIIMMSTLKSYFDFAIGIICGFPSVTLLGEREDYAKILGKLDKLASFGTEAKQFGELLRPIVRRFVRTFDDPKAEDVLSFWQRTMYHDDSLCGVDTYSGWVTAFCFWNEEGKCLYPQSANPDNNDDNNDTKYSEEGGLQALLRPDPSHEDFDGGYIGRRRMHLNYDGAKYHTIDFADIPPGYAQVPVKIEGGDGREIETEMVAGSVGITCTSSTNDDIEGGEKVLDTMQPESGWWIYEKTAEDGEDPPAIAEFRKKALAKGVSEGMTEVLIKEARSSGRLAGDESLDDFAEMGC